MLQLSHASNGLNPRAEPWSHLGYPHRPATQDDIKVLTHWVVPDLDPEVGCPPDDAWSRLGTPLCKGNLSAPQSLATRHLMSQALCC